MTWTIKCMKYMLWIVQVTSFRGWHRLVTALARIRNRMS